jgi:hypothetical protein
MLQSLAMSRRGLGTRGFIMLAVMLLAVVGWLYVSRRGHGSQPAAAGSVLDAVPANAMLIVVVDVKALRATELGQRLLGQGRSIAGLGEVRALCGADPMDLVEQLAVVVPEATELGGFGVFATGAFDADKFLRCAELIIRKRGGQPVRQPREGFAVLRDTSLSLSSAELAVSDGGPLILGEPAYVSAGVKAARARGSDANAAHATLRELVEPGVAVATAVLSNEQRGTLIDELRNQNMADSPFAAVTAGALSVRLDTQLQAHAVLQCGRPAACKAIAEIIDSARIDEAETLTAQAVGLSKVLKGVLVQADQAAVHLRSSLPVEEALTLLRRVLALRKLGHQLEQPAPPAPLPADAGVLVLPSGSPGAASAQPLRRGPTGSALPQPAKPTPRPSSPAPAGSAQ